MPLKNTNSLTLDGFDDEDAFCTFAREARQMHLDHDRRNRDRGVDDSRYAAGFQWPVEDYKWRVDNNIPAMTFNMVPSLLRHRLGARARKRLGPRILPVTPGEAYTAIAQIREGLIRTIENQSQIAIVDACVSQNQLISGIGNYEVCIDYANADVFETDIFIKTDENAWSVIWDCQSTEPTGRDARRVMKETVFTTKDFKKLFPKAELGDVGTNPGSIITTTSVVTTDGKGGVLAEWVNEETVRVATIWIMRERMQNLALLTNGDVVVIGDEEPENFRLSDSNGGFHTVVQGNDGEYVVRKSPVKYAVGYLTNGIEILAEPYEMQVDRVPIVRVPAWLINTGERTERFGMVSFVKDALTFYNYVKSDRIERIVFRNRAQYEAQEDSLSQEQQKQYSGSHKLRGGVLKYRGPKPEQVMPPPVDQAAIIETQAAEESIYSILDVRPGFAGGESQTPPSGISLEHQLNITDSGGLIYDEMLTSAKREVYRIINQLIAGVYDTKRIIKIFGEDGKAQEAILNDPENPESADMTIGKYAIDVSTGPSAETQRVQAIEFYQTMFNANPELMGLVAPELIELLNIPGTQKLSTALRERSGVAEESDEAKAAAAEMQQKQEAIQEQMIEFELQKASFEIEKIKADTEAKLADAQAKLAMAESERAQAEERTSKSEQDRNTSQSKMEEMSHRIELLMAQTEKVYAEISRLQATPIPQPTPTGGKK